MYSKATLADHPIHPALVAFPVVYYASTVAALVAYAFTRDLFWFRVAMTASIAGVVMAVLAAVPGAIDLFAGVPARTAARRTGLAHAAFNVGALVVFAITAALLWDRWSHREPVAGQPVTLDATLPLVLSVIGLCATAIAGSLGWKLVQTHRVGIEPNTPSAPRSSDRQRSSGVRVVVGRTASQVRPSGH